MVDVGNKGDLLTNLFLEVFQLKGTFASAENELTKSLGLTRARWLVLKQVGHEAAPLTVAKLARRIGLSRQAVQRVVNELANDDVLAFCENPDHKRSPLIKLTAKGDKTAKELNLIREDWVNQLSNDFDHDALCLAVDVLKTLQEEIDNLQGETDA